jgi:hypothetical protein
MEHRRNVTGKEMPKYSEITVSVTLLLPQIPNGLAWNRTRTYAVRGRQLNAYSHCQLTLTGNKSRSDVEIS